MFNSPTLSISPYSRTYISNLINLPTPENIKKIRNYSQKKLQLKNVQLQEKLQNLQKLLKRKRATINFLKRKLITNEKKKSILKHFYNKFSFHH